MNNKEFFTDNIIKFAEELYKRGDRQLLTLLKTQKANRDLILQEIANIMLKYNVVGDCMNLSLAEQTKLFKVLSDKIDLILEAEMDLEKSAIGTLLKDIGTDKYYSNSFLLSFGVNFKLKKITNKALNKIISEKISGKNYSNRIWDNKNNVAKLLKVEIKKFLNGETNLNNIEKAIKDKYNSNAFNTKRLAQTEVARVMEGANDAWEKEHDIEYVMYCATLDSKTCTDCRKFDGQTFERTKKPIQLPKHPLCRCTYISLPSKDWKPKTRLDNASKKEVGWKNYKEWKKGI